jgi:hypothetical protein
MVKVCFSHPLARIVASGRLKLALLQANITATSDGFSEQIGVARKVCSVPFRIPPSATWEKS